MSGPEEAEALAAARARHMAAPATQVLEDDGDGLSFDEMTAAQFGAYVAEMDARFERQAQKLEVEYRAALERMDAMYKRGVADRLAAYTKDRATALSSEGRGRLRPGMAMMAGTWMNPKERDELFRDIAAACTRVKE